MSLIVIEVAWCFDFVTKNTDQTDSGPEVLDFGYQLFVLFEKGKIYWFPRFISRRLETVRFEICLVVLTTKWRDSLIFVVDHSGASRLIFSLLAKTSSGSTSHDECLFWPNGATVCVSVGKPENKAPSPPSPTTPHLGASRSIPSPRCVIVQE